MKLIKPILMISGLALSGYALASPGSHGPLPGECLPDHPAMGAWDCIQWGTNSPASAMHATEGGWFGYDGTNASDFVFRGASNLGCGIISASCTLELHGQVRINTEVGNDLGIKVLHGSVTGSGLCGSISISGFDWYADNNSHHGPYTNSSYIADDGTLTPIGGEAVGSMGNVGLILPIIGSLNDLHIHNVRFVNLGTSGRSYFDFDNMLLFSSETPSLCTVDGELEIVGGYDLNSSNQDVGSMIPLDYLLAY